MEPHLLFADYSGIIYRSNLDGSGIQWLVTGLPDPAALDFDYRYNININLSTIDQNLTWAVERRL